MIDYDDGSTQEIGRGFPNAIDGPEGDYFAGTTIFNESEKTPVRIRFEHSSAYGIGGTGTSTRPPNNTVVYSIYQGASSNLSSLCIDEQYIDLTDASGPYSKLRSGSGNVTVTPLISIERGGPSDIAGYSDPIEVIATAGFPAIRYNWQYQINSDGAWQNVPAGADNNPAPHILNVVPEDFLPVSAIGENVNFRILHCGEQATNILNYEIRLSAPHITNITPVDLPCHDSVGGGQVTITFDRPLYGDEIISIVLRAEDDNQFLGDSNNITSFDGSNRITIDDLTAYEGNINIQIISGSGGVGYYSDGENQTGTFTINPTLTPVTFSIDDVRDVFCNGGNDGEIDISASGGNVSGSYQYSVDGGSWITFLGGNTHTIEGLESGTHRVRVRRRVTAGVFCYANDTDGNVIERDAPISEPSLPVNISYIGFQEPTLNGASNGSITARISGGTIFDDNTYSFQWRNSANVLMASTTTQFISGEGYIITLTNIPADTYRLTATDKNFDDATSTTGCTISNSEYELGEPVAISISIQETNSISCSSENVNGDPFSDGELTANANGGVQLGASDNGGLPYYYTWKKRDINGIWQILPDEQGSSISNLEAGEYAVNITDANGIISGVYSNTTLITATDATHDLQEPDLLEITYTKLDAYCFGGNDGSIDLTVEGGTGAYSFEWSNGATTEDMNGLISGTYTVTVTDAKGCSAYETIQINQPEELIINYPTLFEQPTANGRTDGWVEAIITGGTVIADGSYNYEWRNEAGDLLNGQVSETIDAINNQFIIRLENITQGNYTLTVTDANYAAAINKSGCGMIDLLYTLDEPGPLTLSIEESVPISCNQTNEYGNPASDGVLIAHASGGVVFNPGLPYIYTWKKRNVDTGIWEVLTSQTDSIASNLNAGEYAVNIEDRNGIVVGEYVGSVLVTATDVEYELEEPELLQISFDKMDVLCKGESDGWAEITISGGTAPFEILWNNGAETLRADNLIAGDYEVIVTDSRGCTVMGEIEIIEPDNTLEIIYSDFRRPTSIGASDAWIEADISGGSPFDDDSYEYEWADEDGNILNSKTTATIINDGLLSYRIRLNDVPQGTYYLTIRDKNYEIAATKGGCTIVSSNFSIHEPIEARIEIQTPISCNQNNEFSNPFSDGELIVYVEGGVPFSTGPPYNYTWKKQDENGVWQILEDQTTNIASNLSAGNYALNVEDSLGSVIGIYQGSLLIQETDVVFNFEEPELLQLEVIATSVSCEIGNNGTATVSISGGISDYQIEWSNGETTPTINNLIAGIYLVQVSDSRGCQASARVEISQPGGLNIDLNGQNPSCFGASNGLVNANVSGGTLPYTYLWSTGNTTPSIANLSGGMTYQLQITDAEGCNAFAEITLEDPPLLTIDLGEDKTICLDQSYILDASIDDEGASYLWESENGFTSTLPNVELTAEGTYRVTVTSSQGCVASDEINVTASNLPIDAHFVLSTQAFAEEEILLVNISDPIGENVEWTLPDGVNLIYEAKEKIIVAFDEPGTYDINLRSSQGDCFADFSKRIIVEEATELPLVGDANNPFIEEFLVYPNPSNGNFKVKLSLSEEAIISVKVISLITSEVMTSKREGLAKEFLLDYNLEYMPPGTYLLLLETPEGDEIRKLIFN